MLISRTALLEFLNELPAPQRAAQEAVAEAVPSDPLADINLSNLAEGGTQ